MLKTILGILIMAHGLVHTILAVAPNPADTDAKPGAFFTTTERSWIFTQLNLPSSAVQWIGILLVSLSTLGFLLAGLGILGVPGLGDIWRTVAIFSAVISLVLLILFWHPWLPVGVLIDIGALVALLVLNWPPVDLVGL